MAATRPEFIASAVRGCSVASERSANGCFAHGCQSIKGFSGAPIFRVKSNDSISLSVIGIHIGGSDLNTPPCIPESVKYLNIGVTVPSF